MDRFIYKDKSRRMSSTKTPSSSTLFTNPVTKIALAVISIFLLYNVFHSINITVQKLDILRRARGEVDELRLKNLELALLLENIQGVEYLEIQARDRLNFVGESEYVFVIPEKVLENASNDLEKFLRGGEEIQPREGYEVWGDFFLRGI